MEYDFKQKSDSYSVRCLTGTGVYIRSSSSVAHRINIKDSRRGRERLDGSLHVLHINVAAVSVQDSSQATGTLTVSRESGGGRAGNISESRHQTKSWGLWVVMEMWDPRYISTNATRFVVLRHAWYALF